MVDWSEILKYMIVAVGISIPSALAIWAIRGLILARTSRVKAKDQYWTVGEIEANCIKQHKQMENIVNTEIEHQRELIQKDLDRGQERFKVHGEKIEELGTKLETVNTSIGELTAAIERSNGGS